MELEGLEAFVAVCDAGSFSGAAQVLQLSQPALTKRIQQLERTLGGRLFDRGRHGATPTELGRCMLDSGRQVLRDRAAWQDRARRTARGELGRLDLGFGMSTIHVAPQWVSRFRRHRPELALTLEDLNSDEQVRRMRAGALHAGFVRTSAVPSDFGDIPIGTDRLAIATPTELSSDPADHDLLRLRPERGPGLHRQIRAWAAGAGIQDRRPVQESDDLLTVLALVAAGVGTAVVPASMATVAPAAVRLVPVDHPAATWTMSLTWPPQASPAALQFARQVELAGKGTDV